MGHPPEDMGFDYILNMPSYSVILASSFSLEVNVYFIYSSLFFFFFFDAICCDLNVFMKVDELKSFLYSAILCPAPI